MKKFYVNSIFLLFLTSTLLAQQIPFQGRLLDNDRPFNGTATIDFSIVSPVWSETKSNVPIVDGYYSVVLGSTTPLPDTLFAVSREIPLNITVNGEPLGTVTLYSPLLPFTGGNPVSPDTVIAQSIRLYNGADNFSGYLQAGTEGATIQLSAPE